ncbi:MAG: 4-hydroxybenzoate octaprenyltransferase [Gammaproteobacteria bacterium]
MKQKLLQYIYLMRLHKPIGILLLLWPTLWALWIASEGKPDIGVLVVFVAGVVLMRSAGCVINDYADRKIDPHIARTRLRPVASGKIKPANALILFVSLCLLAFALVLTMNRLTVYLSLIGALLAGVYPFMKRYTHLPQVFLGVAFGWAVPMVFAAQTGEVPQIAWLIFIATVLWATAYDTMYGMADRDEDLKIGVKSTAILFGKADLFVISIIQILLFVTLFFIGRSAGFTGYYYLGLLLAAGLAIYQQFLLRDREPEYCLQAFLNNNWLGLAIFAGIILEYMSVPGLYSL